ncbi:hypothetical protein CLOP_g23382 [Closterium sp. NIES-67]|nr:hypothetical protein CLOP_g23382 [Closterium sp. NIES-67]
MGATACWPICLAVALSFTILVRGSTERESVSEYQTSSSQASRPRLVGRVSQFEKELGYFLPRRYRTHPERVNLVTRPLGFPLDTSHLPNVMMGFFERFPLHASPPADFPSSNDSSGGSFDRASGESNWAVKLGCHGPPCPSFGSCTARFPNVQACWNDHLVDDADDKPNPPINCPIKASSAGRLGVEFDASCSHREDFIPHAASSLQMIRLEDVFVTYDGYTVNQSHVFVRNGCQRFYRKAKYKPQHMVHEMPRAVFNWAHQPGSNFYHFMVELVPLFVVAAPLMASTLRHLTVLVRHTQWLLYEQLAAPLIGIQPSQIRLLPTFAGDLFHADVVYQPMFQDCDHPSQALWRMLRRRHLLHPAGLPLFHPDWTYRHQRPLSASQARAFPSDWVVVLAKRPEGKTRSLVNFREVEEETVRRFGRERVVVYDGSLSILQARELFRRARFFIAGHGAALTNMIFMPEGTSVFEIRPEESFVTVFHFLASACSLRYHLVFSKGDRLSTAVADVPRVVQVLDDVHMWFQKEDGSGVRQKELALLGNQPGS